jgi:superfamily II DNA or RNA helicase
MTRHEWLGVDAELATLVRRQSRDCLDVYTTDPLRVDEDRATEIAAAEVGYGRKQLFELVQNGADAMARAPGRIEIVLTAHTLYVANEGTPFTADGVHAVMAARLGVKRTEDAIGRFGLGFKSVVAVSNSPQILSRSVSFGFDRDASSRRIAEVAPGRVHYPVLRIAEPLDAVEQASADEVLSELMQWASTVVRLPLKEPQRTVELIQQDIRAFPAEFLLFVPHVRSLVLRDTPAGESRHVEIEPQQSGVLLLRDGAIDTRWRVVESAHNPSPDAAADAGELARRDSITVKWAVPEQGRNRDGTFWAFFPTDVRTTLSGIVNAPWKMSDDRRSLIEGAFNRELLTVVLPRLIASELPGLLDDADPAAVLDVLPARGREARSWADEAVNQPIFDALRYSNSLPAADGRMRSPRDLILPPKGLGESLTTRWVDAGMGLDQWVHPGVERTNERRLKAERLVESRGRIASVAEWLEALVRQPTVLGSAHAVTLAARVVRELPGLDHEVRQSRILLLEGGTLAAPRPGTVFIRTSAEDHGYAFIEPALTSVPGVLESLNILGVQVLDRGGELRNALVRRPVDWSRVWQVSRSMPVVDAERIVRETIPQPVTDVRVRSAAGQWIALGSGFLGGQIVPADASRDRDVLIDPRFHGPDEDLLTRLGAVQRPATRPGAPEERWLGSYREQMVDAFVKAARGAKPREDLIETFGQEPPWPLEALPRLTVEGRAAMTDVVLHLDSGEPWKVRHRTVASYGVMTAKDSPVAWWLKQHGMLKTPIGPLPPGFVLGPTVDDDNAVLPVCDIPSTWADRLGLPKSPAELPESFWPHLVRLAEGWSDEGRRVRAYTMASRFAPPPERIVIGWGDRARRVAPANVAVSDDEDEYRTLLQQGLAVLRSPSADVKAQLMTAWGLADGSKMLRQEVAVDPVGEPEALLDAFPGLRPYLESEQSDLLLQQCRTLILVTETPGGQQSRPIPGYLRDQIVLVTAADSSGRLIQVSNALHLDLDGSAIRSILHRQEQDRARALKAEIRRAESDPERLLIAVGPDEIRAAVPQPALVAEELERGRSLASIEMAEMALAVHGFAVLRHFRDVLRQRGLNPPQQWAGTSGARRFVTELGFPVEFAGFSGDRRPAVFEVDGPAELPPLHDYQSYVTAKIRQLLKDERAARGMVSLPTGAGKTRVAVQALIEEVRGGGLDGTVVWIAQSDELCEQAVQTWAYIWRALGPDRRLVIGRFWSGNDVSEEPDDFQLVVATPDKLRTVVQNPGYSWMTDARVVVVDEAHRSIAPEYTRVLNWLGRAPRSGEGLPLLGLTATPFRNVNEEETRRLAGRYGGRRLDEGAFDGDPYEVLQARTVLARVQHDLLPGVDIRLTPRDVEEIRTLRHVPAAIEEQLGANIERNRRIVDSIAELPDDWTVLLFATSVQNSRTLAAQLSVRGIPSVSISGETEPAARRRYVQQFKDGEIRVITNYNVLSQGFDAPAVRAVYVTRPTFSANLYQQMIGRGLRGPLNGGSEEVRIVNVRDNFEEFGEQLAFYHFDHLWGGTRD